MTRFWLLPLTATLLTACKVERTPREYFDHRNPPAVERRAASEELQDRLLAMAQALNRGNSAEAMIALAPAPDAYVLVPDTDSLRVGADQIIAAFEAATAGAGDVRMEDVQVEIGPRENVAWFRAVMDLPAGDAAGEALRLTGVYVRFEGAWQLVQAHLSAPTPAAAPLPASPAEAADSLAAG